MVLLYSNYPPQVFLNCNSIQLLNAVPLLENHYDHHHSSYKPLRPSALHRYSCSYGFSHLNFSLCIKATGSRSSLKKPRPDSRDLYTEHHPHNHQAPCGLILYACNTYSFDVIKYLTMRHQSFIYIRLSDPYLPDLF